MVWTYYSGLPDWRRLPGGVRALGVWRDRVLRVMMEKMPKL